MITLHNRPPYIIMNKDKEKYSWTGETQTVFFKILEERNKICCYVLLKWKIENNSSWVNFTHSPEKTHLLTLELIFKSLNWRVYRYIKFVIENLRLKCYKKRLLFTYRATQNNSDALAATHLKWNNKNN